MRFEENVPMARMTTMKVGGPARYFCVATNPEEVKEGIAFAKEKSLPIFILGGGSNVLVSDDGYPGLVMHVAIEDVVTEDVGDSVFVTSGAGMSWDALVLFTVSRGLWGLENLSAIPGTLGGAVVQNIGAYGSEIREVITEVLVYDPEELTMRSLANAECAFGYRDSIFKHEGKDWIILRATLQLKKTGSGNIQYKDLAAYFLVQGNVTPTLLDIRKAVIAIRAEKFPDLGTHGTAGSFFKNPVIPNTTAKLFLEKYPLAPHYDAGEGHTKLSAAWIIDHILNMRGLRIGNVGCSSRQALVIINYGGATADELSTFVHVIQKKSFDACNIALEAEVIAVNEKF